MSAGSPVFNFRMRPVVRERLKLAQDRILELSGFKMGLSTIVRYCIQDGLDSILKEGLTDEEVSNIASIPRNRAEQDIIEALNDNLKRMGKS